MALIELTGDAFSSNAPVLAHGANCLGRMGSGIAKTIRERHPYAYEVYHEQCVNVPEGERFKTGDALFVRDGNFIIAHLGTQHLTGANARLEWIEESLRSLVSQMTLKRLDSVAMPRIGCGIGGLSYEDVRPIIERAASGDIDIEVWTLA